MTENHYHFYASSVSQWATTNDERDLRQLIKLMDDDGFPYSLFLVPCKHTDPYEIAMYQPMVKGVQWLGYYEIKKAKRK
jgi:hypothetical protein